MRIVIVGNTAWNVLHYRGALLRDLVERGHDVLALADFTDEDCSQAGQAGFRTKSIKVEGSGKNPLKDLVYLFTLWSLYRKERPDVVHHFTIKPVIYGSISAKVAGVPRIINTITGRGALASNWTNLLGRMIKALYRLALNGRVITTFQNSDDRKAMLDDGLLSPEQTATILGSGINVETLKPTPEKPERPVFIMVCRMLWSKGVREFVDAAKRLAKDHPGVRFVLVGGSQDDYASANPDFVSQSYLESLNEEGIVQWLGRQPPERVAELMQQSTAVVLPSYYPEGVPRTLLEAAAVGVPAITVDTPGCREAVQNDITGIICPARDSAALEKAMSRLLDSPALCQEMGSAGRKLAETQFDETIVFAHYRSLYEGMSPTELGSPEVSQRSH